MIEDNKIGRYKIFLYSVLCTGVLTLISLGIASIYMKIPNSIKILAGEEQSIDFNIPASGILYKEIIPVSNISDQSITMELNNSVTFYANNEDKYTLEVLLFGVLPFKNVELEVINEVSLIPAGIPVGIYVKTEGVLVIDTGDFPGENGENHHPTNNILKTGDYIQAIDGEEIHSKKEVIKMIEDSNGEDIVLTVKRKDENTNVKIKPESGADGNYKIGAWIRDNAQGIGTLTYIDGQGNFGALGHGINDMDTSNLMNLESGDLYQANIMSITKGEDGKPGELSGVIDYATKNKIGDITENTENGIFGAGNFNLLSNIATQPIEIGLKQEIEIGKAQILSGLDGAVKSYEVEIIKLDYDKNSINKGIVLEITDPELLALTGGIVQGMSGSPILQNGKLIGAVTHVLVQDATKGYGIFIENMLETSEN